MLADGIYLISVLMFVVSFAIWDKMINDKVEGLYSIGDYGKKAKANHVWKFSFFLIFAIMNFLYAFLELQMNITKIIAVMFNAVSLAFFFHDIFIKNVAQEEYIEALQRQSLRKVKLKEIFKFEEDKADYDLSGNDGTMMIKVIKGRTGRALSIRLKEKNLVLTPMYEISDGEIDFFCKQLNFYWTENKSIPEEIKAFDDKALYEFSGQYIWVKSPKIKSSTMTKIKKMLFIGAVILILLFLIGILALMLMENSENQQLNSIANSIYTWLIM